MKKCKDCLFIAQDHLLQWNRTAQDFKFYIDIAHYCTICDIFKKEDGFCDMWEEK